MTRYGTCALDDLTRNSLKCFLLERSHASNRLSLIIVSLLRIVAPPVAGISTVYAINNTLPPTHRPCRDCNILRMYTYVRFAPYAAYYAILQQAMYRESRKVRSVSRVPRDPNRAIRNSAADLGVR